MIHEETKIQKAFIYWFRKTYPNIPTGMSPITKLSYKQGALAKSLGYTKGWPDIFIPQPSKGWAGLFIEMKSERGKISDHQKVVLDKLRDAGYKTEICRSVEDAINVVKYYIDK